MDMRHFGNSAAYLLVSVAAAWRAGKRDGEGLRGGLPQGPPPCHIFG